MSKFSEQSTQAHTILNLEENPQPPEWIKIVFDAGQRIDNFSKNGFHFEIIAAEPYVFVSGTLKNSTRLSDSEFPKAICGAYTELINLFRKYKKSPLRFWNYLPDIGEPTSDGFTQYELFNSGRFDGFRHWYGKGDFGDRLITASCVGHRGKDFVLHTLLGPKEGRPFENPRQIPAYRYSDRYGILPPCFSRANLLVEPINIGNKSCMGIIAGTASIVGEDSVHKNDLDLQLQETCMNLGAVSAAMMNENYTWSKLTNLKESPLKKALARYFEMRVYIRYEKDAPEIETFFRHTFPNLERLELAIADICRVDLLLEAEGLITAS